MNNQKQRDLLIRNAIRVSKRHEKKYDKKITKEELQKIKVPTVSFIDRIYVFIFSIVIISIGIFGFVQWENYWMFFILVPIGVFALAASILGKRRSVENIVNVLESFEVTGTVFVEICSLLDI